MSRAKKANDGSCDLDEGERVRTGDDEMERKNKAR
jgi:hypothetical protein